MSWERWMCFRNISPQFKMSVFMLIYYILSVQFVAYAQDNRFLEFRQRGETLTYDLSSVKLIQPGRYSLNSTTISDPDVIQFKLRVLHTLQKVCARPDGHYAPPKDIFVLGAPDLPVRQIEVVSSQIAIGGKTYATKRASWSFPYERLAIGSEQFPAAFHCKSIHGSETEIYMDERAAITNGVQFKELIDCRRGLMGLFRDGEDNPSKVHTSVVRRDTNRALYYAALCRRLTNEPAFEPL